MAAHVAGTFQPVDGGGGGAAGQPDGGGIPLDTPAEELAGTLIAVFEGYVLQS